jgi:hypothetical protein
VTPSSSSSAAAYRQSALADDTALVCAPTHQDLHTGKLTIRLKDGRWINEHGLTDGPSP